MYTEKVMKSCPNVSSVEWKRHVEAVGEGMAWASFIKHGTILEVVDNDVDPDTLAQQLGLQDANKIPLGKTKSIKNKIESKYVNVTLNETKAGDLFFYDLNIVPLESREYYENKFRELYPDLVEMFDSEYQNVDVEQMQEAIIPSEVSQQIEQTNAILDNLMQSLSNTMIDYKARLNKIRKNWLEPTFVKLNHILASTLNTIKKNGVPTIDSTRGSMLANMFGNLENPAVLQNFINNNGLTNSFLNPETNQFLSNEEILTKMFDVGFLSTLDKAQQNVVIKRLDSFIEKVRNELSNVDVSNFVESAFTDSESYNKNVTIPVPKEESRMPSDSEIMNMPEFTTFNEMNPNTSLQDNLEYFKKCKL